MFLSTHAIAGAAVATLFPEQPAVGLAAAFVSHFFLDAIPHYDYKLESTVYENDMSKRDMPFGPSFVRDLWRTGIDSIIGLVLSLLLFGDGSLYGIFLATLGAGAGVLPDVLQFVYMKLKPKSLVGLQRFHEHIQRDRRFQERPKTGIPFQVAILAAIVAARFFLERGG